jgi:hypothetical protein
MPKKPKLIDASPAQLWRGFSAVGANVATLISPMSGGVFTCLYTLTVAHRKQPRNRDTYEYSGAGALYCSRWAGSIRLSNQQCHPREGRAP